MEQNPILKWEKIPFGNGAKIPFVNGTKSCLEMGSGNFIAPIAIGEGCSNFLFQNFR